MARAQSERALAYADAEASALRQARDAEGNERAPAVTELLRELLVTRFALAAALEYAAGAEGNSNRSNARTKGSSVVGGAGSRAAGLLRANPQEGLGPAAVWFGYSVAALIDAAARGSIDEVRGILRCVPSLLH
eukprot:scaffold181418_cov32-Tisochrysis_lutea.AAC.6